MKGVLLTPDTGAFFVRPTLTFKPKLILIYTNTQNYQPDTRHPTSAETRHADFRVDAVHDEIFFELTPDIIFIKPPVRLLLKQTGKRSLS